jgi:hypothetical protein
MKKSKYRSERKHHIIYQITNLVNNKIYIGAHSTNDLDDDYYGSGINIKRAIEKYGKLSFKKEILYIFETTEEMLLKEKELVNVDFLKRKDVYNIVEGGYGSNNKGAKGCRHMHHPLTEERCAVHQDDIDKMLANGWQLGRNMSSTTNTIWIHKENLKKMIPSKDLDHYINKGWTKGLPKSPTAGKIWIYHRTLNKYSMCSPDEIEEKLSNGWIKKKWSAVPKGTVQINNGKENRRVSPDDLDSYLDNGWAKGMITTRWVNHRVDTQ